MVTKQQQLEWLAENGDCWPGFMDREVRVCAVMLGRPNQGLGYHTITKQEWRQERDKMQKQAVQSMQSVPDNSWHERGELPPVGCECECNVNGEWTGVYIIGAKRNGIFVMEDLKTEIMCYINKADASMFRPIRTEREKAIDEIAALVSCGLVSHEMAREFAVNMYDAGLKVVKR